MKSYITMLPILQAQEDLRHATVTAYGSGMMKAADGRAWARERRRVATQAVKRRPRRAVTDLPPEQMAQRLATWGIAVEFVPAPEATP